MISVEHRVFRFCQKDMEREMNVSVLYIALNKCPIWVSTQRQVIDVSEIMFQPQCWQILTVIINIKIWPTVVLSRYCRRYSDIREID